MKVIFYKLLHLQNFVFINYKQYFIITFKKEFNLIKYDLILIIIQKVVKSFLLLRFLSIILKNLMFITIIIYLTIISMSKNLINSLILINFLGLMCHY